MFKMEYINMYNDEMGGYNGLNGVVEISDAVLSSSKTKVLT